MFKNLKSLFINEEEDANKSSSEDSAPVEELKTPVTSSTKGTSSTSVPPVSPGKITDKFNNILLGAMEANNIDGFDYLEYRQSLQSLKKMDMDEATQYKSAYAMAQTMGASPEYLIKTANHYMDILKKEEAKFGEALQNQRVRQVGEKEQQLKDLEQMIRDKAEQIQKMSKDIEQHQVQMQQIETEVAQSSAKVESTKNNFIASFNAIVVQIKADVENMQKYLK